MHKPLSLERLNWLTERQAVVETMINRLKLYINANTSSTSNTQVLASLGIAQAEFLNNQVEIVILKEYFDNLEKNKETITKQ